MKRLYLKLYVAFLGIVLFGGLAVGLAWHAFDGGDDAFRERFARGMVTLLASNLQRLEPDAQASELTRLSHELSVELEVYDANGRPQLSSSGHFANPTPPLSEGFVRGTRGPGRMFRLADGRFVAVFFPHPELHHRFFAVLALFGLAMAIGCYPLARQITRRLEQLQHSVDAFGSGTLEARAKVRGKDEVARLAQSFNAAAAKIEALIAKERRMLASASHELRSPLARVRMAVELLETAEGQRRTELVEQVSRDVEELDQLVEDLLTSVRTENPASSMHAVDLRALLAEEAAHFGVPVEGDRVVVEGDRRMLKRLGRNLLENALQHGKGAAVRVRVSAPDDLARVVVEDEGPGVPEPERERIFEPFYRPASHDEGEHGGVGLGLALVRQIAEHHRGRAWVEAREGGGSRFVVELATRRA